MKEPHEKVDVFVKECDAICTTVQSEIWDKKGHKVVKSLAYSKGMA